jgi:hypothetical protein
MTDRDTRPDDEAAADPATMLALLTRQQRSVHYQQSSFVWIILLSWAIAWGAGFVLLWFIDGAPAGLRVPLPVAATGFGVLVAAAIAVSIVFGVRSGSGVRASAANAFQGTAYGFSWTVAMVALWLFALGLQANGLSGDLLALFYSCGYVLMTGVLFFVSAAVWQAKPMLFIGGWTVVVAVVAPFFGYPGHYLVLAAGGGGGLLVMAIVSARYTARLRREAARG